VPGLEIYFDIILITSCLGEIIFEMDTFWTH